MCIRDRINIVEYDDMKECILKMIREGYLFNLDRDRLRDAMEDLTYMYSPNDDLNKDRVSKGLEYEYSDDEDEISDDEDDYGSSPQDQMNIMNMMMKDPSFAQLLSNINNLETDKDDDTQEDTPICPVAPPSKEDEEKKCDDCPDKETSSPEDVKVDIKEVNEEPTEEPTEEVNEEEKEEEK